MLDYFQTNPLSIICFFVYYGCVYLGVYSVVAANYPPRFPRIEDQTTNSPAQESLSTVSDPVLQAENSDADGSIDTSDKESSLALSTHDDPVDLVQSDTSPVPYKHEFWPSPRPVNFVKVIQNDEPNFKVRGRLAHTKAVDILAERAFMSRREFLRTNPITYSQRFMKGMNALYLLKDSIDQLEQLLREETYRQDLRRIKEERGWSSIY
jgi:hypothetical protein